MAKQRVNVTLTPDTVERLRQYAYEQHLDSISAAITDLTWKAKVKNTQLRGQQTIGELEGMEGGKK